ncbi:myrosinase 1-like [Periplaneta americana]|uniref:myrosinase 1-like n=1 Tax=Periplaneta americana TaxID=6978 RepID=UPI0037E9294C
MKLVAFYLVFVATTTIDGYDMRLYRPPYKVGGTSVQSSLTQRNSRHFYLENNTHYSFPNGFLFGVATSAYQIEGAPNEDGKGVNIWDTLIREHPEYIADRSNADVACDSYHLYKEDVQLLKTLGVHFYRFSISWSRILPTGRIHIVNQAGIDYYNNLINELIANGIKPLVTMYHWDLPQPLQDLGGWANPQMAEYFEDYAYILFSNFGDRVKVWITFNEPDSFIRGYGNPRYSPAVNASGTGEYLATKTMLLSHARVYHLYYSYFRSLQQGKLGITLNIHWCEPLRRSTEYIEACERYTQFRLGLFAHPIFSFEGDYPQVVKERIKKNSLSEGFKSSRLPSLTLEEIEYIKGTWDFFGLNHYTTVYGSAGEVGSAPSINRDVGVVTSQDPRWPSSGSSWLKVVPWGFRKQLNWIAKAYNNPPVLITEIGFSDLPGDTLKDIDRVRYYTSYMSEMLKAIYDDGCNVIGFSAWSLMDNFEWNRGYTEKFGFFRVDFTNSSRPRIPKESAYVYSEIIRTGQIPVRYRNWAERPNLTVTNTTSQFMSTRSSTDNAAWPIRWPTSRKEIT